MRLGLYGGSFDPIHRGHIDPVLAAVSQLSLDRVLYLPTGSPPHKPGRVFAPAWQRYVMAELALLDRHCLRVSSLEVSEDAPAYTIDSISHFQGRHPDAELILLLGADSFLEIETFHRWRDIVDRVLLAVLPRSGSPLSAIR